MSRARCRHENADHLMPGDRFAMDDWGPCHVDIARCEQLRCLDCGEWLSLGASNDAGEAVAIEQRAAEIAAGLQNGGYQVSYLEQCGFNDTEPKFCLRNGVAIDLGIDWSSVHAGYLAGAICNHGDGEE